MSVASTRNDSSLSTLYWCFAAPLLWSFLAILGLGVMGSKKISKYSTPAQLSSLGQFIATKPCFEEIVIRLCQRPGEYAKIKHKTWILRHGNKAVCGSRCAYSCIHDIHDNL